MKKLLASVLCLTFAMSFSACNSKKEPEKSAFAISEITSKNAAETPETTSTEPSASATGTTVYNPAFEFVKEEVKKAKVMVPGEEETEEEQECSFYFPKIQIKSSYADSVNKELSNTVEKYIRNLNNENEETFYGSAYIPYLTKDGILSIIFVAESEYELNEYKVYNIDTKTGEKVDNARIAQAAGVSDIRKAAMDALQNWYNKKEIFKIKNYKVVVEKGEKKDAQMKDVEKTFSAKNLNDKMQIGLTNEGKMFFVSTVDTTAGAEFYNWVYDVNGNDLADEDNQFWVGERTPVDDDDEEGDAEEDDAFPPLDDGEED